MEHVRILKNRYCHICDAQMNSWDGKLTKAFHTHDTCEKCFLKIYDMDQDSFRDRMETYLGLRPCIGI